MTENGNPSGGGYNLPDVENVFTPEQADELLNRITADWTKDPAHPYYNQNHPQYTNWVSRVNALNRIKYEAEDPRGNLQRISEDAMARQEQAQSQRIEKAEEIMRGLEGAGFEHADIPPDLTEAEVTGLQVQLLAARGHWPEVEQIIQRVFEELPLLPHGTRELFYDYKRATGDDERLAYVTAIARSAVDTYHQRIGFKRQSKSQKKGTDQ